MTLDSVVRYEANSVSLHYIDVPGDSISGVRISLLAPSQNTLTQEDTLKVAIQTSRLTNMESFWPLQVGNL